MSPVFRCSRGERTRIHPEAAETFPELFLSGPVSITAMRILNILPLLGLFAATPLHAQTAAPAPECNGKAVVQKLLRMTPEERREFLKTHPEIRERMMEFRKRMHEKLQSMTPEQKQQFLQNHPRIAEFLRNHRKAAE